MTALTFPTNPTTGDTYSAPNNVVYVYDGEKWTAQKIVLAEVNGGTAPTTF